MAAIETAGLTRRYGGRAVVDGVALLVPDECVYGFLGPNGAGKTTTIRMLVGLLRPHAGTVRLLGHDIATARRAALSGVGALIEGPALYDHLSGRANLSLTAGLLGLAATEVDRVLDLVDLRAAATRRVGGYSLGMKQRLAIARALLGRPRLLLLDEPTNGLDPDGMIAMRALIRDLPDRIGGTVFISSHLLGEVEQVADRVGLMLAGRLVMQDSVRALTGRGGSVRVGVAAGVPAATLLRAAGFDAQPVDGGVRIAAAGDRDALAARANRLLVEAGHAVTALVAEARTLEQVYQDAVTAPAATAERIAA
jgi:lantibiotic transport system ATP-binding protein